MDLHLQSHIRLHGVNSDGCTFTFTSVPSTCTIHPVTFCYINFFTFSGQYNLLRTWNFPTKIPYTLLALPIRRLSQVCRLM